MTIARTVTHQAIVAEGQCIPRGYGIAYALPHRAEYVCYPLGLNLLVAWGRRCVLWLRNDQANHLDGYSQGWQAGYAHGQELGRRAWTRDHYRAVLERFMLAETGAHILLKRDPQAAEGWIHRFIDRELER